MKSYPDCPPRIVSLSFLCLVIVLFTVGLVIFKTAITGQAIYGMSGPEIQLQNLTVTFEAQPIPADAIVVVHVAGMTGQQPLRTFAAHEPYTIVYGELSMQGFDEPITVPFERFGIPLPSGAYNISLRIVYEGVIIDQIIVPLRVSFRESDRLPPRIIGTMPSRQTRADYTTRVLFIGLGIVSFLVAILIVLSHGRIFRLPPDLFKTRSVVHELVKLIGQKRAKGHSDDSIMQELKEVASHDTIVAAFVALDGDGIRSYIISHRKKGYSSAQIRIALERHHLKDIVDKIFDKMSRSGKKKDEKSGQYR